ncbi:MAG: SusC/RagA family TonB-linked outer membrane protein [Bacteroidia bacterium]
MMNLHEYAAMAKEYYALEGGVLPGVFEDPSLLGEGTNWQDELFNNATMQKHNFSLSGGTEKSKYYLSGEYFDQEGVAIGSGFERISTLLKVDNKLSNWLDVNAKINLSQTNTKLITGQENIISTALQMTPNIPVKNFDGTYAGGNTENINSQQFLPPNPIGLADITTNDQLRRRALGGFSFNIRILEGLNFVTSFNGDIQYSEATYFQPAYKFGFQERPAATLSERAGSSSYWNFQQMLTYDKTFGNHALNVMALHEAQKSRWKNTTSGISDFVSDLVVDLNLGNSETATVSGGKGSWAQESFLGRLNYNFGQRYYLMTTFRADGSSNFGANNKWGFFPSAALAWRVSQEPFFNTNFINELRLRLETGITGNQGGSGFIYGTLGTWTTPWGTGFALNRYPNPDLQWEETLTNNVGVDISFFESRVQLEFDYYIKKTDGLLTEAANPDYLGVTGSGGIGNPFVNIGSIRNEGWTIQLKTQNISTQNFNWSTNINFSTVDSKIESLNSETGFFDRTSWWMNNWTQRSAVGQAPWLFYGYVADGLFESVEELETSALPVDNDGNKLPISEDYIWIGDVKYKDISGPEGEPDGIIDTHDQTYIGNPNAKYTFGVTNSFSYKAFELSVLITGALDYDVYNYTAFQATNPNNINLSRNFLNIAYDYARIGEDDNGNTVITNSGTNMPRINSDDLNGNFSRHSSRFVEDGSFLRVKNITLSYNVPASFVRKSGFMNAMRVALSVQNIATITNYTGYDPEIGAYTNRDASAGNQAIGVDNGRYPSVPLYTATIGIQF